MLSRRSFFTRDTLTRPFKSRRTFNALNRSRVRVLVAEGPLSATSAASRQHKAHDWVDRYLFVPQRVATSASNGRRVQLARSLQHSILHSNPNEAPSKQLFVRVSPSDSQPPNLHPSNNHRRTPPQQNLGSTTRTINPLATQPHPHQHHPLACPKYSPSLLPCTSYRASPTQRTQFPNDQRLRNIQARQAPQAAIRWLRDLETGHALPETVDRRSGGRILLAPKCRSPPGTLIPS